MASTSPTAYTKDDASITFEGEAAAGALALVFQNKFPEAKVALANAATNSIQGAFAQAFFAFIQGFLTQEPDELKDARSLLEVRNAAVKGGTLCSHP
jgi:hypothetical protein